MLCCYFWPASVHSPFPSLDFLFEKLSISECAVSLAELPRHLSSWAGRESKLDWLEPQAQPLENLILEWSGARRECLHGVAHSHTVRGEPGAMRGQQGRWTAEKDRGRQGRARTCRVPLPLSTTASDSLPGGSFLLSFNLEQYREGDSEKESS